MKIGFESTRDKSAGDLGQDALRFILHSLAAIATLALVVTGFALTHPPIDAEGPKLLCTGMALLVPMLAGLIVSRTQGDKVASYVWVSGLLTFSIVCVWVLDLPTGPGLCEKCGAVEKLSRTFFEINHGSGLMGGDGLLVGTWVPLSMVGYALGAKLGFSR